MNSIPREQLCKLVERYKRPLGENARLCESLLRDVCGAYRREIFILVSAIRERVPTELLRKPVGVSAEMTNERLVKRLEDNLGLTSENCQWAVETWEMALAALSPADALGEPLPPWQLDDDDDSGSGRGRVNVAHVVRGIWTAFCHEPGVMIGNSATELGKSFVTRARLSAAEPVLAWLAFPDHEASYGGVAFCSAAVHYLNPTDSPCPPHGSVTYGDFPHCQFAKRNLQEVCFAYQDHAIDLTGSGISRSVLLYALNAIKGVVSHA